ncbi:aldehyde dehydrogenase family protein [Actinoplanes sp. NPDC051346]|uniref:aldehyde dehydrogenase family protein n=1 Tax=Actinoplanes sp. NPDC051346 TaxID=3155048 RepID=UPI0034451252
MSGPRRPPTHAAHWIHGGWQPTTTQARLDVVNPADGEVLASVADGTPQDAHRAVDSAREAFGPWSTRPLKERIDLVSRFIDGLERRADEIAMTIMNEVGTPLTTARRAQVGLAIAMARSFLPIAEGFAFERRVGNSLVVREPAGVVVTITPWNVPLLLTLQKIIPALLAGCTVVHKPSEITPLHALALAEVAGEAGLPPGVLNVVVGRGTTVGAVLVGHPDVDLVSLTGSTRAGRQVAELASATIKRLHLELGGKNAAIALPDADLAAAVRAVVDQVCFNTGQACLQWSRLLVPAERHDEAVALAVEQIGRYHIGDPADPSTDLGPLVSEAAFQRVNDFIETGIAEGATLACGGPGRPEGLTRGWYVRPTVFARVDESMTVAQEEIFGPVLAVMGYRDEDDAVRIANSTRYGLHGAVFSADPDRALAVAARLRTGQVDINGGSFNILAPFGGFKQSGLGRECGEEGLDGFCEIKSVQLPTADTGPIGPRLRGTD